MFLSLLEIDPGVDVARTWLGNPYRVHQRLAMAFPDSQAGRALFRIEDEWSPPRIIVQTQAEADWDAAFRDLPVLASRPRQKPLDMAVSDGDVLRFRLRANPTKRLSAGCPGAKWTAPASACSRKPTSVPGLSGKLRPQGSRRWRSTFGR